MTVLEKLRESIVVPVVVLDRAGGDASGRIQR